MATRATEVDGLKVPNPFINVDYNVFEGWKIDGRPSVVAAVGRVTARDGKFVGIIRRGKIRQRKPGHI